MFIIPSKPCGSLGFPSTGGVYKPFPFSTGSDRKFVEGLYRFPQSTTYVEKSGVFVHLFQKVAGGGGRAPRRGPGGKAPWLAEPGSGLPD